MQLELFDYRRESLFDSENQIAHYYDVLKETHDSISYSEHINPKKGYAVCGMEYEEYIDVKKDKLRGLTYDQILNYLKVAKKEERLEKYKALLKFRNILDKSLKSLNPFLRFTLEFFLLILSFL